MKDFLRTLFDPSDNQSIASMHQLQKNLYGVYAPPTLKQLMSLKHLLISTGSMHKVQSEELLGLSKSECQILLKKLNSIYISHRRNHTWRGVGPGRSEKK